MPLGMPGQKSVYVNPEEAEAMEKIVKEREWAGGQKISEASIMKAALRLYLKLDE